MLTIYLCLYLTSVHCKATAIRRTAVRQTGDLDARLHLKSVHTTTVIRDISVRETPSVHTHWETKHLFNPFMPIVVFNICCPRDCVSRHNGGTAGSPLKPLRDDSALSEKTRSNWKAPSK